MCDGKGYVNTQQKVDFIVVVEGIGFDEERGLGINERDGDPYILYDGGRL